jgi:hypothetical protein
LPICPNELVDVRVMALTMPLYIQDLEKQALKYFALMPGEGAAGLGAPTGPIPPPWIYGFLSITIFLT